MKKTRLTTALIAGGTATAFASMGLIAPASAHDAEATTRTEILSVETSKLATGEKRVETERTGVVSSIDGSTIVVTSVDSSTQSFVADVNTDIERNDVAALVSAIVVGDRIEVEAVTTNDVTVVTEIDAEAVDYVDADDAPHVRSADRDDDGAHVAATKVSEIETYQNADLSVTTEVEFYGTITAVNGNVVTVEDAFGIPTQYDVTNSAVERNHVVATSADLVVGDVVELEGTQTGDAISIARVEVKALGSGHDHDGDDNDGDHSDDSMHSDDDHGVAPAKAHKSAKAKALKAKAATAKALKAKKAAKALKAKKLAAKKASRR